MKDNDVDGKWKPTVVVVGGGPAGIHTAAYLDSHADQLHLIFIDSKDYFEFVPDMVAVVCEDPGRVDHSYALACIPHSHILRNARILVGVVRKVTSKAVLLEDGEEVAYDYLAVCTGTNPGNRFKMAVSADQNNRTDRARELSEWSEAIHAASSVLVVGGGPLGVEVSAEILAKMPGTQVTLVEKHEELLHRTRPVLREGVLRYFRSKPNMKVYLGQQWRLVDGSTDEVSSSSSPSKKVRCELLSSGEVLEADLLVQCVGVTPNSALFSEEDFPDVLDERGYVKIKDTFQLVGFQNVFAAGDVCNLPVEKTNYHAYSEADVVGQNILSAIERRELQSWSPPVPIALIRLGPRSGVGYVGSELVGLNFAGQWSRWLAPSIASPFVAAARVVAKRRQFFRLGGASYLLSR